MTSSYDSTTDTSTDTLTRLHDHYVEAVNIAVAEDDQRRIDRLAAEYDQELAELRQLRQHRQHRAA